MNKINDMKVLISGNGNLTVRDGELFVHHEIADFLRETRALGLKTEYATIVLDAGSEAVKNLADEKFPADIPVHTFGSLSHMPRWKRPFAMPAALVKMAFLALWYDFVYCYYPGALARMLTFFCRLLHKPYGLNVRGEVPPTRVNRNTLRKARFILADGVCNVTRVVPEYKNCREIVPMCSIFQEDIPPVERDFSKAELHGLFVGRVERNKGMFELFEAMAELKRRGVPVRMTLVGAYGDEMTEAVRRLDIADRIAFAGLARDPEALKGFYRDADFFCLPTYTEGFPRVLYEAMAHALPCLTTLVGGIPSRMHADENCLALEPRSADSIVRAITSLVGDRELAQRLSVASLDTFHYWQKRFSGGSHAIQLRGMLKSRGGKMLLERFWNGRFSGLFAALWYAAAAARQRIARGAASFFQCSRLGRRGRKCRIGRNVTLNYPGKIEFGDNVHIGDDVFICGTSHGSCKIADGVHIDRLGRLDFSGELRIGRNTTISEGVTIETHSHGHDPRSCFETVKLEIGEHVWIGMRALILPQVGTIGDGAIVGAGAVVTRPVPPRTIVAGIPAVVVGTVPEVAKTSSGACNSIRKDVH